VIAIAGVARPERFFGLLERLGVVAGTRLRFADHHPYDAADLDRIRQAAGRGAHAIVTTEKDLVKLARLPGAEIAALHAVRIEVAIERAAALVDLLLGTPEVELRRD
jgi:tetraacyldisaccharide 4'-kinase